MYWNSDVYDSVLLFREYGERVQAAIEDIASPSKKRVERGLKILGGVIDADVYESGCALCARRPAIAQALIAVQGSRNNNIRLAATVMTGRYMGSLKKDYSPSATALRQRIRDQRLAN